MNRIVREHYPVSKLPEDLREGFGPDDEVRVTVDVDRGPSSLDIAPPPQATLQELFGQSRATFATVAQIDEHLRHLRDEWD